jgi:hypothetical protein
MARVANVTAQTFERGDIVTVDGGNREYLVRALHSAGRDVLLAEDDRTNAATWVAIEQVTFKRSV